MDVLIGCQNSGEKLVKHAHGSTNLELAKRNNVVLRFHRNQRSI